MTAEPYIDPAGGVAVMTPATFGALVAHVRGEAPTVPDHDAHIAALTQAGIIGRGDADPALAMVAAAVREPSVRVSVQVEGVLTHGWQRDVVVLLRPVDDDRCEVLAGGAMFLPMFLAECVGLGPRPSPPDLSLVTAPRPSLDALGSPHAFDAGAGVPLEEDSGRSVEHLRSVSATLRRRWSVDVRWVAKAGAPDGQALEVIDSDAGFVIVWDDGDGVVLHPASPTEVWIALTQLVPEEHEADLDATLPEGASSP